MKNESNQFPKKEKKSRYKHDFKVKEGCLSFSFFGYTKYFFGTDFFDWLKENNLEKYFEYVSYEGYGEVIMVYMNETVKSMNKKTKEIRILKHFPYGLTPYIKGAKPKIDNPIKHIKEEYLRRDDEKREYEENIMKEIEQDNIRHGYVPEETELNENSVFKKGVLALMAFFLSMGIQKTYAQCSADLQAAMRNPNDPKNAKILSGAGTDLDLKINIENGFGGKYQMMSKEDRIEYQKQLAKEKRDDELYKKALLKEFKRKFDPDLDLQGDKLPKPEIKKFQQNFKDFLVRNPQFKIDPSRYTPEERYAFLTKVVQEQSLIRRLNVLFGRPNPFDNVKMTVDELYKLIQDTKINGFDNFTEKYREGFPGVPFPDNPHKFEKNILDYNDFLNENWLKKAALAGALTAGALSGQSQQKIDKFADFQKNVDKVVDIQDHIKIDHSFNSPDDVNKWLKSTLDTNTTWEISKMEVIGDTKLHIKFNADKSKDGFNRIVFTCNKQTLKEEDKSVTKVLAKNPDAEVIYSGSYFTLNGIDYDWYLIGINTGTAVKYTPNISKTDNNNKPSKDINKPDVKKGLIDAHAYAAIYKFETTKGRIVKGSDGKYKATTMEANGITYDVHQKDNVIKNHIENAIGLDTWFKIPPKFRMQIFSYMFNSDSYEDKKGDRFRWLAGLAQSVNPSEFGTDTTGRRKIMKDENVRGEAIKYIKGLGEEDFVKAYDKYLEILRSQYASLSTDYGKAYDDAAKELSWFVRPIELDKYYGK
jgi:hypothetical protein